MSRQNPAKIIPVGSLLLVIHHQNIPGPPTRIPPAPYLPSSPYSRGGIASFTEIWAGYVQKCSKKKLLHWRPKEKKKKNLETSKNLGRTMLKVLSFDFYEQKHMTRPVVNSPTMVPHRQSHGHTLSVGVAEFTMCFLVLLKQTGSPCAMAPLTGAGSQQVLPCNNNHWDGG